MWLRSSSVGPCVMLVLAALAVCWPEPAWGQNAGLPAESNSEQASQEDPIAQRARLWGEAIALYSAAQYEEALRAAERHLALHGSMVLEPDATHADNLSLQSFLCICLERWDEAQALAERSLTIRTRLHGPDHPLAVDGRKGVDDVRQARGLPPEGLAKLREALRLYGSAIALFQQGKYDEALPLAERVVALGKEALGPTNHNVGQFLHTLGEICRMQEDFQRAEQFLLEARDIRVQELGAGHHACAMTSAALATVYLLQGDYARAEPLLLESSAVFKTVLGENNVTYATAMNNLASLYDRMGRYSEAERHYVQARDIYKQVLGETDPNYALTLNNLAFLYYNISDYAQGEPLAEQALAIFQQSLGREHPNTMMAVNNLAAICERLGETQRAETLHLEMIDIYRQTNNKRYQYVLALNNLAFLYYNEAQYGKSEPLFLEALELCKHLYGEDHENYAMCLNNLGGVYEETSRFEQAEQHYRQASDIWKRTLGEHHLYYATSLGNRALLHSLMREHGKAEALYRESLDISREAMQATASIQSQRQQLAMSQNLRHLLDNYVACGLNANDFARDIFQQVLAWKGATLMRQRGMRLAADDPQVSRLFSTLQEKARQFAALGRAAPESAEQQAAWRQQLAAALADKERVEAELSARSAAYREAMREVTLDDLLAVLPDDAVLVDYLQFMRNKPGADANSASEWQQELVAFVVRRAEKPEDQVKMIGLGDAGAVDTAIDTWRRSYGSSAEGKAAGALLRRALWEPLLPYLGGEETAVLVSSDGSLGRLPLVALPGKQPGSYLLEDHRLAMIPVPQLLPSLLEEGAAKSLPKAMLLIGNVDYDGQPDAGGAAPSEEMQAREQLLRGARGQSPRFQPLASTGDEVDVIQGILVRLLKPEPGQVVRLGETAATTSRFRELAPQCLYVHVATHGFFAEEGLQSAESAAAASSAAKLPQPLVESEAPPPPLLTGIGAALQLVEGGAEVVQIVLGGSAAADGRLRSGDIITKVGQPGGELVGIAGKSLNEVVALIRGPVGSTVRLEVVVKASGETVVYEFVRKPIPGTNVEEPTRDVPEPGAPLVVGYAPGLLSGLVFAGANREVGLDEEDGILTAEEIASLPLDGVRLVTLSACETGLGLTAGGEGLLGLQRAFQVSGARTTIASCWEVNDLATRLLMERFYRNLWEKGMSKLDALREAQLYIMRGQQDDRAARLLDVGEPKRKSPRDWAAFTLSGDWR